MTVGIEESSVLVRRARPADLDGILALYGELAGGRTTAAPSGFEESQPLIGDILADSSRHLIVAIVDGRVAGTADLLVVANLTHHGKPWAVVENIIVMEELRRSGLGSKLVGHLIDLARGAGCYKLQLHSGKQRTGAHAFYRSLGLDAVAEGFKIYFDG